MSRSRPWHRLALGLVPLLLLGSSHPLSARPEPASDEVTLVLQSDLMGKTSPCGCHVPKGGFARLADEYHAINRDVHRAETGVEPVDSLVETEMRKKRAFLKDEIARMLVQA